MITETLATSSVSILSEIVTFFRNQSVKLSGKGDRVWWAGRQAGGRAGRERLGEKKGKGLKQGTQKLTNIRVLHYFVTCILPSSQVHLVTITSTRFTGMFAKNRINYFNTQYHSFAHERGQRGDYIGIVWNLRCVNITSKLNGRDQVCVIWH